MFLGNKKVSAKTHPQGLWEKPNKPALSFREKIGGTIAGARSQAGIYLVKRKLHAQNISLWQIRRYHHLFQFLTVGYFRQKLINQRKLISQYAQK